MDKRLYRSERYRVFLGVCGGMGEYFNIDPVLIRVITVILVVITGFFPGLITYLILALVIPSESSNASTPADSFRENISDMRNTTVGLGEEIRTSFGNKEDQPESSRIYPAGVPPSRPKTDSNSALYILGIIAIVLGVFFLLTNIFGWLWGYLWPFLLVLAGVLIILAVVRRKQ